MMSLNEFNLNLLTVSFGSVCPECVIFCLLAISFVFNFTAQLSNCCFFYLFE